MGLAMPLLSKTTTHTLTTDSNMAIQYPTFRADPGNRPDFSGVSNLPANVMQGIKIGMLPYQIKQEQAAQAMKNALMQQQMQKEAAQAQMYGAHSNLYGLQSQYYPQSAQADIASKQAQAFKNQQLAQAYAMLTGAQPGMPQQTGMQPQQPQQQQAQKLQQAMRQQQGVQQPGMQQQDMQQPQQQATGTFSNYASLTPQQKMAASLLNINLGNVYPGEVARQKAQSTEDVKRTSNYLTKLDESTGNAAEQSAYYGGLISKFSDPNFINAVGPINSTWQKYFPDENIGQLKAELDAIGGNLKQSIIQMGVKAPAAMGRFASEIKPDTRDTAINFYGKAIAGQAAKNWQIQFNRAQKENIKRGMDPEDASIQAMKDVPFEPVLKQAEQLLNDSKLAADYKRKFNDQQIRTEGNSIKVSIPGSKSFVAPSNLHVVNGKLYVQLPNSTKAVPAENYDSALQLFGGM